MTAHATTPTDPRRVALDTLDQATVRALTDSGYLGHADYVALARANGWRGAEVIAAPRRHRHNITVTLSHESTRGMVHQVARPPAQRIGFV